MPFQDYGYKPSGITRPKARPTPKPKPSSSYYSGNEFGSGNIFTETSPGASTVNFGNNNNNNNDNDNNSYQAPSLMQPPAPTVTAPAAPTPAQIEAERQDRIARVFEATGATLPQDTGRGGSVGRGIDLYSRDVFKTPFVATPDNTQEIKDYLGRTAVEDALREALGVPEVYQGMPTQEEPEPNIDMSVLQEALQPEPITVEELPEPQGLMSPRFDTKGGEVAGATTKAYDFLTKAGLNPPENQLLSEKLAVTGDQFTNREDALEFIDTSLDFEPTRKAAFSATVDAESSSGLLERSNYTKQAAIARLGGGDANRIARIEALYGRSNRLSPEDQVTLFDIAYGGRMGNAPDEGHKYRGRGLIQITGKDNYRKYGEAIGMGDALVNDPDILLNNPAVMLAVTEAYLQDRLPERSDGLSANDLKDAIGHSGDVPRGVTWRGTGSAYKGNQRWMDVVARLEDDGKQDEADEARLNNEFTAQQKVGAYIDGDIGPNSIRQMRSWLASKNVNVPEDADAREIVRLVNATN